MSGSAVAAASLDVSVDARGTAYVQVVGPMDAHSGGWLADLAEAAPGLGVRRMEVELSKVESFDTAGASAVQRCRRLASRLTRGIVFHTGSGAGRDLLLASLASLAH